VLVADVRQPIKATLMCLNKATWASKVVFKKTGPGAIAMKGNCVIKPALKARAKAARYVPPPAAQEAEPRQPVPRSWIDEELDRVNQWFANGGDSEGSPPESESSESPNQLGAPEG
jgi:hypothetical protein